MTLFEELKRRKVFRVAATYAVVAWILMQIGEVTFPALKIPEWVMSTLVVLLLSFFAVVFVSCIFHTFTLPARAQRTPHIFVTHVL